MTARSNVLEAHNDAWPGPGGPQDVFAREDPDWYLPRIVRGDDIYLFDEAGNRYIDISSGPIASNLGHNNRRVVETIKAPGGDPVLSPIAGLPAPTKTCSLPTN